MINVCIQHSQEWVMSLMEEQNIERNKTSLDEWLREPQVHSHWPAT